MTVEYGENFLKKAKIVLISIYSKTDKESLSDDELIKLLTQYFEDKTIF